MHTDVVRRMSEQGMSHALVTDPGPGMTSSAAARPRSGLVGSLRGRVAA
jgi:hypothetical protein